MLEDIVDHTNVGAVFRCAAALGFDGVGWHRGAPIRCTGGRSRCPWVPCSRCRTPGSSDWRERLAELRAAGFRLLALDRRDPERAAIGVPVETAGKIALLVGGEGHGLSARWLAAADLAVRIPMSRGVDSLNVASAAAIADLSCHVPHCGGRRARLPGGIQPTQVSRSVAWKSDIVSAGQIRWLGRSKDAALSVRAAGSGAGRRGRSRRIGTAKLVAIAVVISVLSHDHHDGQGGHHPRILL